MADGSHATNTARITDMPPGYWLVKVDYYLGGGSYKGTADFTPDPAP